MKNTLFYGDNLDILRDRAYFPDECVDLIYLDPPFNSQRSYNVLFKDESGLDSEAQIQAFDDTWHWGPPAAQAFHELVGLAPPRVSRAIEALRDLIGENQMMAYLVMMAARLAELQRVLKPTGSLYLHCDPTASHYLKIVLDAIFGPESFQNDIVWKRTSAHNFKTRGYARVNDHVLFYTKGADYVFNQLFTPYGEAQLSRYKRDEDGRLYKAENLTFSTSTPSRQFEWRGTKPPAHRSWGATMEQLEQWWAEGRILTKRDGTPRLDGLKVYLDEMPGNPLSTNWDDIGRVGNTAQERLGYPTQKPLALLERIISASSNPGDIVLDPFCGCGTAIAAAHKLDRRWIGIDITHLSVSLMKYRLADMFSLKPYTDYQVVGEPTSVGGARQLAQEDPFNFQFWALSLVQARPLGGEVGSKKGKRGADRGIDGLITFMEYPTNKPGHVIIQVKSGKVKSGDIRDLVGTMNREKATMGVFITLEPPTRDMITEAASAGYYDSSGWGRPFPRIQILTIEDLLSGRGVDMPPAYGTFKRADRVKEQGPRSLPMFPDQPDRES